MPTKKIVFITGKGGVGKTTVSALIALYLSQERKVGVYSFDPAHNLADVLGEEIINQRKNKNLIAQEVDFEHWKKQYLQQIKKSFKSSYSYLAAYNMLDYFDIFDQAPDADNLGMILAFDHIMRKTDLDLYIFDMPPTAVALEFFNTVRRNLRWIEALISLRQKIIEKKEIISRIKLGKKEIQTDKVMTRLQDLKKFYTIQQELLNNAIYFIVRNDDQLSQIEANRIQQRLTSMKLKSIHIINNKYFDTDLPLTLGHLDTGNILGDFALILKKNNDFFKQVKQILL